MKGRNEESTRLGADTLDGLLRLDRKHSEEISYIHHVFFEPRLFFSDKPAESGDCLSVQRSDLNIRVLFLHLCARFG